MTKILITGGSGLIGNEVVKQLIDKGFEVNVLDLWPIDISGINYFKGSITNIEDINKAIHGCSYVFHLAAVIGVSKSLKQPVECLDVNIIGTRNVLECCIRNKIKKIVFSSSSEVYGEPEQIPVKETDRLKPKSEYGASKYIGEEYLKAFKKQHDLNYSIVRFFNIFGPEQKHAWVMPIFVNNALLGKKIKVNGDGQQTRAFCYVEDAVRGVISAMFSEKANGEIFNIGNSKNAISMKDLAQKAIELADGKEEQLEFVKLTEEESDRSKEREIFQRIPDTSKAKKILGFEAEISLEEGIKKLIEHKKENIEKIRKEVEIAEGVQK